MCHQCLSFVPYWYWFALGFCGTRRDICWVLVGMVIVFGLELPQHWLGWWHCKSIQAVPLWQHIHTLNEQCLRPCLWGNSFMFLSPLLQFHAVWLLPSLLSKESSGELVWMSTVLLAWWVIYVFLWMLMRTDFVWCQFCESYSVCISAIVFMLLGIMCPTSLVLNSHQTLVRPLSNNCLALGFS